jgi:hypothetical protein
MTAPNEQAGTVKIVDYAYAKSDRSISTAAAVQFMISNGWQPYGNPIMTPSEGLWQAMVKYEDTKLTNKGA